ncbi:zinc ribbon domain-containing protein [Halostella sp. JP-L12]|uniref:DUF7577 domain-containing protein n=1 Tax=Halostella TaxID=1843185 RepID=UPI000EF79193|nr:MULTISPECIES: zinc ribbon domain-containing protein [Halostella]NHN47897.1 zinc ribbon domain-containing protein [Halostella sp. JP-L12]
MESTWLYAALFALVAVQLAAIYLNLTARRDTKREDGSVAASADAVTCPDCGAENEREYRFCRRCVGELPGSAPLPAGGGAPRGRRMF